MKSHAVCNNVHNIILVTSANKPKNLINSHHVLEPSYMSVVLLIKKLKYIVKDINNVMSHDYE